MGNGFSILAAIHLYIILQKPVDGLCQILQPNRLAQILICAGCQTTLAIACHGQAVTAMIGTSDTRRSGWAFYYFFLTSARLELELHQAREEMAQIAITDPLTGLHNRRYLMEHGAFEFERAKREQYPVSIVFIDLDNLKTINDKFGHEAGDMALNFLTHTLQSEIRPYDLAVRFGGDEFILLLPNTHTEEAASIAERIRTKAGQTSLPQKFNNTYIYLSLGVASSEEKDINIQQVLQRADGALYQAKNEGRNRVIIH